MAAKKKRTKVKKKVVSPYVKERIQELSEEHGWDPAAVEASVSKANKGKGR